MRRLLMAVVLSAYACASTTYYVSSSGGDDSKSGTSAATAWKTLGKINASAFAAGDRILLARGDVWRETLTPPSSGASGNPIAFDAYGSGAAPEITSYQALWGWTQAAGYSNQWKAAVTASAMNYVLFGTVWGTKQASQPALLHDRDFYLNSGFLYVYAPSDPSAYYGTVAAMVVTNSPLISVSGKQWLTFQHIKLDWFDQYGVYVTGTSDHLVFANMEADGMIPAGSLPHGFYVSASNPNISFYNDAAHLNYDGFRVDGTAAAITLENCAGYANRDSAVVDNTGGHVTYAYSHFYANGTGGIESPDVAGAVAGAGNLAADTAPNVEAFARYPARFSFTVDDVGLYAGSDTFVDALIPVFNARGLKMNAAVVAGPTGVAYSAADVASWVAGRHEVDSHSWSHQYFTDPQYLATNHIYNSTNPTPATAFSLKYVGTGTAATVTLSGGMLSTSVTGGPGGQNLGPLNLSAAPYDTLGGLTSYISSTYPGVYTVTTWTTPLMRTAAHSSTLASFSAQDIKTSAYGLQFDPARAVTGLMADEAKQSRDWLQANIAGLSNVKVYVYPDGVTDPAFEAAVAGAGYEGARGTLSMCVSGAAPCSGANAFASYATGVNAQNIPSLTPVAWTNYSGLTRSQLDAKVAALIFKMRVWGYPVGLFVHANDYPDAATGATKTGWLLDSIAAHGGSISRNDELIEAVLAMQAISGTTKYVTAATGPSLSMRTKPGAPGAGQGKPEGTGYAVDLAGASRLGPSGWDIGAYQALWTKHGSGTGPGHFTLGAAGGVASENAYCLAGDVAAFGSTDGPAALPQACVYTALAGTPSPGAVRTVASDCSDLQTQINSAAAGDTVVIPASATCTGNYTFPAKTGADRNHWITVRTSAVSDTNFPGEGTQATPCQINVTHIDGYPDYGCGSPAVRMPKITSAAVNTAPVTVAGAFYRFIGLNITKNYGTNMASHLVVLDGSDHVILDRCLIHGDEWSQGPHWDTHGGVSTRGTYQAVVNSWIYDIDWNSPDGYAVSGGTGSQTDEGPIKLYNNLMAGASETWIFGGGAAVAWPHDYEIRRNLSMKPLKWMVAQGAPFYNVSVNVKNLGEFKHGHRILYEDNVFTNDWEGQSDQYGSALLLLPKNQSSQNTSKFVNTNGTAVACASDAAGTPCGAHTGPWGNTIVSLSRTNGIVTLNGSTDGGWPYYNAGGHIVLQGIPPQVANGVNLASFNGEWVMGCLNPTTCTDGYDVPKVLYFAAAGPDFPLTNTNGGLAHDFTASTCANAGQCRFSAPKVNYPLQHIVSVEDSEHITTLENLGTQTGVTQATCHPGLAPNAQIQDFTARYNYMTHAENIGLAINNAVSGCADITLGVSNISIHDNLADDIDTTAWTRTAGCCGHGGAGPSIINGYANPATWPHDISFAHNTWAGMRGWPSPVSYYSSGGFEVGDNFNLTYTGTYVTRAANVVTIEFGAKSGVPSTSQVLVAGFTGGYADLNGAQTLSQQNTTSVVFTEAGSHADIARTQIAPGTTGLGTVELQPTSYYANVSFKDNIFPGPLKVTDYSGHLISGGVTAGFANNLCDPNPPYRCTWTLKNNLVGTAVYAGYPQSAGSPYPAANPDTSATCTVAGGCFVTNFTNVFQSWGGGVGDTRANDYRVQAAYKGAGSDGRDPGADMARIGAVKQVVLPGFTYSPLVIATNALAACTNGVYCEQQLLISSGASGANGFVRWRILSGTLPAGMTLATNDGYSTCQVNGSYSKTGPTGCVGWIWGTPTQSGSFPVTFQAEDAAHQTASVSLTLTVN